MKAASLGVGVLANVPERSWDNSSSSSDLFFFAEFLGVAEKHPCDCVVVVIAEGGESGQGGSEAPKNEVPGCLLLNNQCNCSPKADNAAKEQRNAQQAKLVMKMYLGKVGWRTHETLVSF